MSTVTTRLCVYEDQPIPVDIAANMARTKKAIEVRKENTRRRQQEMIAKIEGMVAAGADAREIVGEFRNAESTRKTLYRLGRKDLARLFGYSLALRRSPYSCAMKDCRGSAFWIEDPGFDPDDEPIAEWSYLCVACQEFEDLAEDLEFLLDPRRGNETDAGRILSRVGYEPSHMGLDALMTRLKRRGRVDLRDAIGWRINAPNDQRGWPVRGTVRSDAGNIHWYRLASTDSIRAYERMDNDPGRRLLVSTFG